MQVGKRLGLATLLVGHVTKDGAIAGPRVLEHLVDVVLHFEGDRASRLRFVRAVKNRFGPVDEVGCFDLSADGIVEVTDPTGLFVSRHVDPVAGTCVTVTLEGRRPLLAEVQALVAPSTASSPPAGHQRHRRPHARPWSWPCSSGGRRCGCPGPTSIWPPSAEPGSASPRPTSPSPWPPPRREPTRVVPTDLVALGEVGLAGEVRRVSGLRLRLAEAARLGFRHALVPADSGIERLPEIPGLQVIPVPDVTAALRVLGLASGEVSTRVEPNHGRPRSARLSVVGPPGDRSDLTRLAGRNE